MSVDKFGRHNSSQIYAEPGVSVRYVNNNFIRRDGSNDAEGELNMNNHKITNVADPTSSLDAVNKNYADNRKPIITIWASHQGPLHPKTYEFSFGDGVPPSDYGYVMPVPGRIIRIAACSKRPGPDRIPYFDDYSDFPIDRPNAVIVQFTINGNTIEPRGFIALPPGIYVTNRFFFHQPIELSAADCINFKTLRCNGNEIYSMVSLLIELDL